MVSIDRFDSPEAALQGAVKIAGSQSALARRIGSTQGSVWRWLNGVKVPPKAALRIEQEFGIARQTVRPDIYPPPDSEADNLPTAARTDNARAASLDPLP